MLKHLILGLFLGCFLALAHAQTPEQKALLKQAKKINKEAYRVFHQGEYDQAFSLGQQALDLRKQAFGETNPDYADSIQELAWMYSETKHYSQAEPLYQQAIEINRAALGEAHPGYADSLRKLAELYWQMGEYARAVPIYEQVIEIVKNASAGKDAQARLQRENYLLDLGSLARLYQEMKEYPRAEKNYRQVLELIGQKSSAYSLKLKDLAGLYEEMGDYLRAAPLYQEALAIEKREKSPSYIRSLTDLANLYYRMEDYSKAEPLYREAIAFRKANQGKNHPFYAFALSNLAMLYTKTGEYAHAESLLEEATQITRTASKRYPIYIDAYASNLGSLAMLYVKMGEYARAEHLADEFIQLIQTASDKYLIYTETYAETLAHLAGIYHNLGAYAQAEPLYQMALKMKQTALGEAAPEYADSLDRLARLYQDMGDYVRAEPLFQQSLEIRKTRLGEQHPDYAGSLDHLAGFYQDLGDYARAKPLFQHSLEIRKTTLGEQHPDYASSLDHLAGLYQDLGDYAQAERLCQQALSIIKANQGEKNSTYATYLNNLAALYSNMGEYARAEPLYQQVLQITKNTRGEAHPDYATSLSNLALLYSNTQDARAEPLLEQALEITRRALGETHPSYAIGLHNLASAYHQAGDDARAEPLYREALAIAGQSGQPELLWRTQHAFHRLLRAQNHPQAAIFLGKQAVNTIQNMRAGFSTLEKDLQTSFLADKQAVYQDLADLLIEQGRLAEAQRILDLLKQWEFHEFIRRDGSEPGAQADFASAEQPWAARYAEIQGRLAEIGEETAKLRKKADALRAIGQNLGEPEQARLNALREDLKVANQAFNAYLEQLKTGFIQEDAARAMEIGEKNLGRLKALQSTLRDLGTGVVLLHYVLTEDKLHILVTTGQTQWARSVEVEAKQINRAVFSFRREAQQKAGQNTYARRLYDLLIKPIAADLEQAGAEVLMVSLDGVLRYAPLAALHDGDTYLAQKYAVVMYTEAAKSNLKDTPEAQPSIAGLGLSQQIEGFSALPAVEEELQSIVRLDENDEEGVLPGIIHLNQEFTEESLAQALDQGYSLLHIASHFVFRPGTEQSSFLLLGDGSHLSLGQIRSGYDFNGLDLITLSACETALDGNADGREVEGFGALAQRQGAKSVIATLWPVDDVGTALFMRRFYQMRQEGLDKARAMQKMQQSFIASPEHHAPYYWAPFILMGNWL